MRAQLPREVALDDRAYETLINREPERVRRLLPLPPLPPGHPSPGAAH